MVEQNEDITFSKYNKVSHFKVWNVTEWPSLQEISFEIRKYGIHRVIVCINNGKTMYRVTRSSLPAVSR